MRLGVFSDAHPDWTTLGKPRLPEVERLVDEVVGTFIREGVDVVAFCGDLCDPDRGPVVLRCAQLAIDAALRLAKSDIPSIWLAGNHDVFEDGSGCTSLSPLRALWRITGLVHVSERPESIPIAGVMFHTFPFTATSHAYDAEAHARKLAPDTERANVVLSHLHLEGIQPGEETKEMPRGRSVILPVDVIREQLGQDVRIFNGHFHKPQDFNGVHVVGSLARFTKGEEHHAPSFTITEVG